MFAYCLQSANVALQLNIMCIMLDIVMIQIIREICHYKELDMLYTV